MAGEIIKTKGVCLDIRAWSKTSHVVAWLTPKGRVATVVKGAVRPKSQFLGQYDLNYTCETLYYARARGEVHALREVAALNRRDALRDDYRALALAGYFRRLAAELSPTGSEAEEWYDALESALDRLASTGREPLTAQLLVFEMRVLEMMGLSPNIASSGGEISLRGERKMPVSAEVAACLLSPAAEKNLNILLDAARVIGVFYQFHVDCASDVRRTVLGMISKNNQKVEGKDER